MYIFISRPFFPSLFLKRNFNLLMVARSDQFHTIVVNSFCQSCQVQEKDSS